MHPIPKLRESGRATAEQFAALLDENVVMHSPLSAAEQGDSQSRRRLAASCRNRDYSGDYVLERKLDDDTALRQWKGTIDGHGFREGSDGKLKERTVAYRPFPALRIFRDRQRAAVGDSVPADSWDHL
jgi:hypothetical protein